MITVSNIPVNYIQFEYLCKCTTGNDHYYITFDIDFICKCGGSYIFRKNGYMKCMETNMLFLNNHGLFGELSSHSTCEIVYNDLSIRRAVYEFIAKETYSRIRLLECYINSDIIRHIISLLLR
jgi:hypothetical protein